MDRYVESHKRYRQYMVGEASHQVFGAYASDYGGNSLLQNCVANGLSVKAIFLKVQIVLRCNFAGDIHRC